MSIVKEIEQNIIDITLEQCGFEDNRDYISLSNMVKPVDEIISDYQNGYMADEKARLKCYKGYQMEKDLVRRVIQSNPDIEFVQNDAVVIDARGPVKFKGHPDIIGDGLPFDCKSLLKDEWLPESWKNVSRKIKFQMQSYIRAMNVNRGFLIYESRESGLIKVIEIRRYQPMIDEINAKIDEIKKRLTNG